MTEAEYAFYWFSFMFLHKAFFMLSCYFVAAFFFLIYLGCQTKKESLPPCTLFSWKTSFNCSMQESEQATCHRSQATKGSLQSLSVSRSCHSVPREVSPLYTCVLPGCQQGCWHHTSGIQPLYLHFNKNFCFYSFFLFAPRGSNKGRNKVITNSHKEESAAFGWTDNLD